MNCSKCGQTIDPAAEKNYGTDEQPTCESCAAAAENEQDLSAPSPSIPAGTMCVTHNDVPAVQLCQMCGAAVCKTCDFEFPGNIHVCPNCVNKPQTLSPKRKKNLVWSYIFASIATIGFIFCFYFAARNPNASEQGLGFLFLITSLAPAVAGLSLGTSARTRGRKTPVSTWIAILWSGAVIGLYVLLIILGSCSS